MFRLLIFIALFVSSASSIAETKNLNQIMSEIGQIMVNQYPVIVAKQSLTAEQKKSLYSSTVQLKKLFQQAQPLIEEKSDTYRISHALILAHLDKIETAFQQNQIMYARKRLRSMGTLCSSCHTQDTQLRTLFNGSDRSAFSSDLDFAEFSFMTRNYQAAIKYYDKFLSSDVVRTELDIILPLQRMMTIYLQIYQDPVQAKNTLSKYLHLRQHSKETKKHLQGWITGLEKLASDHPARSSQMNFSELKKLVKHYIGDTSQFQAELFSTPVEEVSRVWLRGRLYHYLNDRPPVEEVPAILYWLSICDRTLGYDYNHSFADLYLKDCITRFSDNPFAIKCLKEYESFLTMSYSGSGGTFIPAEVEDELYFLKKQLKKH